MSTIFDPTMRLLAAGLDVTLHRQNVIMGNVANLDTPGYIPRDVQFGDALREAQAAQAAGPVGGQGLGPALSAHTVERPDRQPGPTGNAVELDVQMGRLAQNSTLYGAASRGITRKLALMRYVVSEGGF